MLVLGQEIGEEERIRDDLFCVAWDVTSELNQFEYGYRCKTATS